MVGIVEGFGIVGWRKDCLSLERHWIHLARQGLNLLECSMDSIGQLGFDPVASMSCNLGICYRIGLVDRSTARHHCYQRP